MAAHRTRRPPAALLLEAFPAPPSHIPASPSPNPPPTGPPSTPLPPVPGPSRLSGAEHHQLLSSLASRAHRPPSTASTRSGSLHGHGNPTSPTSPSSPSSTSTPRLSTSSRSSLLTPSHGPSQHPHGSPPRGPRARGVHAPSPGLASSSSPPSSYPFPVIHDSLLSAVQPQLRDLAFSPAPLSDVDDEELDTGAYRPPFPATRGSNTAPALSLSGATPRRPSHRHHQANESLSEIDVADILRATANDDAEGETGLLPPFELSLSRSQNSLSRSQPARPSGGSLRRSVNGDGGKAESLRSSNDSLRTSQDGSYFASDSGTSGISSSGSGSGSALDHQNHAQARRVALSTSATPSTFSATSMPTATATPATSAHRANSNANPGSAMGEHQPTLALPSYLENHHPPPHHASNQPLHLPQHTLHHPHAQKPPPQKPAPAADHPLPPLPPPPTSTSTSATPTSSRRPPTVPRIQTDLGSSSKESGAPSANASVYYTSLAERNSSISDNDQSYADQNSVLLNQTDEGKTHMRTGSGGSFSYPTSSPLSPVHARALGLRGEGLGRNESVGRDGRTGTSSSSSSSAVLTASVTAVTGTGSLTAAAVSASASSSKMAPGSSVTGLGRATAAASETAASSSSSLSAAVSSLSQTTAGSSSEIASAPGAASASGPSVRPARAKPPPLGGVRGPSALVNLPSSFSTSSASSLHAMPYPPSAMARTYSSVSAASSVGSFHTAPSTPYLNYASEESLGGRGEGEGVVSAGGGGEGMAGVGTWDRSRMGAVGMLGVYQHQHELLQSASGSAAYRQASSAGTSALEKEKVPGALAAQYERDSALPYLRPSESTSTQWSGASALDGGGREEVLAGTERDGREGKVGREGEEGWDMDGEGAGNTSLLALDVRGMVAAAGEMEASDAGSPLPPAPPPPLRGGIAHTPKQSQDSSSSSPPLSPPPSAGLGLSGRFHTRMSSMGLGLHSRTVSSGDALADEDGEASFATFMGGGGAGAGSDVMGAGAGADAGGGVGGVGKGPRSGRPGVVGVVGAAGTLAGRRRNGLARKDSTVLGRMDDLIRGYGVGVGEGESLREGVEAEAEAERTTRTSSEITTTTKQMPSSDITIQRPSSSSATPHTPPSSSSDAIEPKVDTPPSTSDSTEPKMERRPSVKDLRRELRAARVRSPGLREAFMGSAAAGRREGGEASGSGSGSGSGSPAPSLTMSLSNSPSPSLLVDGMRSDAGSSKRDDGFARSDDMTSGTHDKTIDGHEKANGGHDTAATGTYDTPASVYDDTSSGLLRVEMDDDTRSLASFETSTSVSEEREPYLPRADPTRAALLRGIVVLTTTSVAVEEATGSGSVQEMTLDELGFARDPPGETERMPNGPIPTASTSTMGASGSTASTSGHPDFGASTVQHPKTPMRSTATVSRASVEEVARLRALTERRQREKEERARAASPDIVTILRTTPRPALVKGRVRARSASRTRTRSRGAGGVSSGAGRMSASVGAGRRGVGAEDSAEWDEWGALKRSGSGAAALGAGPRERAEEGESDSSIDLHTPLPHLMVRHGLLSPYSKLLPGAASRTVTPAVAAEPGGRPGSMMSVASNGSGMTKSGLIKDERDTHTRRVRHRDGRLLAGGIGLTTGLGWSDSEDEDAPSPLTRRISSLNLSRRSSASSVLHHSTSATYTAGRRTHPLSRSYSASALALGLPRHPEERERVLDEYDDEYEDGPEDHALQTSGEWAQRQRRAAGAVPPPTSWAARSVGAGSGSGTGARSSVATGSASASLRSSVGGETRTSTSSIGSAFSLEVTPARTPSRMRKPSGGRMSMERQYQRTSQSTSQTPVARQTSRDELNTPSSTASTLSLPMPSTPRDEFDSASVSTTTTTTNAALFGLGVGQAKSRGSLDKDKSLPPLPPGGIKRMASTPRVGSNEVNTTAGATGKSTSRIGVPRSRTVSTMSGGRVSNSATTPLPPSAAFGPASTAQRTPPSPAVRPLQLPRVRAAAAAAAGGDRAAVPVPSVSGVGYGLASPTSASSLASPPITTRGSLRSPTSSFSSSATSARAVSPGPPSTAATPRPKPRTGTGMVYRTSSGSGLGARGRVGGVGPAAGAASGAQRSATGSLGRAGGRAAVF